MTANPASAPMQLDPVDSESVESKVPRPGKERLQSAIGARMAAYLRPVWPTLAMTCLLFAISHLALLPPRIRWIMFAMAAGSSVLFASAAVWIRHRPVAGPTATMLGGLTALVLWLNGVVHLFLLQQSWDTTNLIIVLVGTAMLLLDRCWFSASQPLRWVLACRGYPASAGPSLASLWLRSAVIRGHGCDHPRRPCAGLEPDKGLRIAEEERKAQLELSLQDTQLRLASIWQNSREGLVISDETGRLLAVNRSTAKLVGIEEADLPGRRWVELFSRDSDLNAAERVYSQVFDNPESVPTEEREVVLADGRRLWLATSHLRLPQPGGQHQLLTLIRDVTERRRFDEERLVIERQMQEAQRLESLGILAGGIAHDFNNLLTGILGNLELMRAQLPLKLTPTKTSFRPRPQLSAPLTYVIRCWHMRAAVTSRSRTWISMRSSARRPDYFRLPCQSGAARVGLAPQLPGLRADGSQLRQVVMNLVINSAEAIGDGPGVIHVSTRIATPEDARSAGAAVEAGPAERFLCLEVQDASFGMAPEIGARIFDPFFSTKFTGRGLGLAAVVGIVRRHGGGLSVESTPGRGSTFRIFLPALDRSAAPSEHETGGAAAWRGEGTLLVIDDEPVIRQLLCSLLEGVGFQVLVASDGAGVELMRERSGSVRLILLDLTMPRMDGRRTLDALRHLPGLPPVILMSGYTEHETHQRFADQHLSGFLQKPFTLDQLTARLKEALSPTAQDPSPYAPRAP
jgi:PAS domain S-box-containing protein